ncbi:Aminopeptidase M1-D [Nymphon striatum]|nr:Aminopeptidase M1-D [Nymphon striatum]
MENFGCATFREILLIVDTETATPSEMERSVDVIAHEIAHMWFGDLVTMTWWEGIWLKEAFATFCELLATDAFAPEWDRWTSFGLSRTAAFDTDSLLSTRPIEFEVVSPADAEAMYDVLTYEKGAAVVRMLQMFLGPDEFKQGINHYLTKHAYGNTQTHDLWDALEESTGQPARKIMDSWIFQGGYPLVTVDKTGPTTVRFSQERFGYSADTPSAIWGVPLVLTVSAGGTQRQERVLLDTESIEVDLGGEPIDWIQGNAESSGFYRVRYAGELQQAILDAHRSLTALERYSVVDDSWASFMADRLDHSQYRSIIEAFADEDDLSVWQRITGTMLSVDHHLTGDQQAEFQTWAQGLLVPALERIGTTPGDDDSDRLRQTRAALFSTLGQLNHAPTVTAARSVHADTSDPTLKAASATVMAATGTAQEWDEFAELYRNAPTPQEERRYLYSLAGFPGADEMSRVLALIDSEQVRSQDAPFVLATAMRNGQHGQKAWDYMVTNWDTLNERYPRQRHPSYGVGLHLVGRARAGNRNPLVLRPASTPPGRQNPGPVTGAFGCSELHGVSPRGAFGDQASVLHDVPGPVEGKDANELVVAAIGNREAALFDRAGDHERFVVGTGAAGKLDLAVAELASVAAAVRSGPLHDGVFAVQHHHCAALGGHVIEAAASSANDSKSATTRRTLRRAERVTRPFCPEECSVGNQILLQAWAGGGMRHRAIGRAILDSFGRLRNAHQAGGHHGVVLGVRMGTNGDLGHTLGRDVATFKQQPGLKRRHRKGIGPQRRNVIRIELGGQHIAQRPRAGLAVAIDQRSVDLAHLQLHPLLRTAQRRRPSPHGFR